MTPTRAISRWLLAVLAIAFAQSGCAVGPFGTIIARRTVANGAEIVDTYAFGALARPLGVDRGLTLGYRHASYLYPLLDTEQEARGSTWRWGFAPIPARPPLLRASTTIGVEAQLTAEVQRCTIGYLDQVLTIAGRADESRIVKLHYPRSRPQDATLDYQEP
jgi:hypothetical protein